MTAALELGPNDRVLEIGTGSGYAAAILGRIAREVYTIERTPSWPIEPRPVCGSSASTTSCTARLLHEIAEPIAGDAGEFDVGPLLERVGDVRIVRLGEATHGTSDFYALRANITKALVRTRGFTIVAGEADLPDAPRIHRYVRGFPVRPSLTARAIWTACRSRTSRCSRPSVVASVSPTWPTRAS
jgi:hypothetical protein